MVLMAAMVVMMFVAACNAGGGEASASSESTGESGPKQNKMLTANNKLNELEGDEQAEASKPSEVSDESSSDRREAEKKNEAKPEQPKKEPEKPKTPEKPKESNEIFNVAEVMPQYPGGMGALSSDISSRVTNSEGVQGRVVVKFVVEKNGSVSQASVVRSSGSSALDREVLNGARSLKRFTPAKNGGQPVRVWYTVPVSIR